jgi:glycosyltransferase involved in cell wall biosynthesis
MRVAVWAANTIGGTEKAAALFAAGLARRGFHVDFLGPKGPQAGMLEKAGIPMLGIVACKASLKRYFEEARPDIVHQHVPGYPISNPLYEICDELGGKAPALIETNVFGHFADPRADQWVRFRLFISLSCAVKAFKRGRRPLDAPALNQATVACYPLPPRTLTFTADDRREFRRTLGVGDNDVLAVRVGQRSLPGQAGNKWKRWECEAFARARRAAPHLRFFIMEPPSDIWRDIEAGRYGQGIILHRNTSDFAWLSRLYSAADCMVHASSYGESFGYTIAEAMEAGLPVIVRTTPWGDNAQVELVQGGETGFVCASVGEMSRRLRDLAMDSGLRRRMGEAAVKRIQSKTNLERELDVLEGVIETVSTGKRGVALQQRAEELLRFASDFPAREWRISEPPWSHPLDYLGGRVYSGYRRLRICAAHIRNAFQARITRGRRLLTA